MSLCTIFALVAVLPFVESTLISNVDTRLGSSGFGYGAGNVPVSGQVPYGFWRGGPDTVTLLGNSTNDFIRVTFDTLGGYSELDDGIYGFSLTKMVGAGVGDLGNFRFQMYSDNYGTFKSQVAVPFNKEEEIAIPGYYSVVMDNTINATMSAYGTHSGVMLFQDSTTANVTESYLVLDLTGSNANNGNSAVPFANLSVGLLNNGTIVQVNSTILMAGALSERASTTGGLFMYFYAEISGVHNANGSLPIVPDVYTWENGTFSRNYVQSTNSTSLGVLLDYPLGTLITARSGISFIDVDHAMENLYLQGSLNGTFISFDNTVMSNQAYWEEMLLRINATFQEPPSIDMNYKFEKEGDDPSPLPPLPSVPLPMTAETFYSALYRVFLAPTTYSEANGDFLGMDFLLHNLGNATDAPYLQGVNARYLSDLSLWDTHRTHEPLKNILDPSGNAAASLMTMAVQGGKLPRWPLGPTLDSGCMVGSHGASVIIDSFLSCSSAFAGVPAAAATDDESPYITGSLGGDVAFVLARAMQVQHTQGGFGQYGFVSSNMSSTPASDTMEFAFDDGTVCFFFNKFNGTVAPNDSCALKDAFTLLFSTKAYLMCPRYINATSPTDCSVEAYLPYPLVDIYTEGNGLQWSPYAPQDGAALWNLNNTSFDNLLWLLYNSSVDWPFVTGMHNNWLPNLYLWMGNEPSLLLPLQYNQFADYILQQQIPFQLEFYSWKAQFWTLFSLLYYFPAAVEGSTPWTAPGNDDYSTMSAWMIWASLGIYPVSGMQQFMLVTPSVASATLQRPSYDFQRISCSTASNSANCISSAAGRYEMYGQFLAPEQVETTLQYSPTLVVQVSNYSNSGSGVPASGSGNNFFISQVDISGTLPPSPIVDAATLFPPNPVFCQYQPTEELFSSSGFETLNFILSDTPHSFNGPSLDLEPQLRKDIHRAFSKLHDSAVDSLTGVKKRYTHHDFLHLIDQVPLHQPRFADDDLVVLPVNAN